MTFNVSAIKIEVKTFKMKHSPQTIQKIFESMLLGRIIRIKNQFFQGKIVYKLILLFGISLASFKMNAQPIVLSVGVPANGTYITDQNLDLTVNFSEPVTVVTSGGMPYIAITLNTGGTVNASYESGSGTSAIVFRYIVAAGNDDINGISVGAFIMANGGTLKDGIGNNAAVTLNNVGSTAGVLVDAIAPSVSSMGVPANNTYTAGQYLDFTVNFSEAVNVVTTGGTPFIPITLNTGGTVHALYLSGSGTTSLVFRYTVVSGNESSDGVAIDLAITSNGGTIKDLAGNGATLILNGVASASGVLVDALAPSVTSVGVPPDDTYITGQNLDFFVNFSEEVIVNTGSGTPYISITLSTGGLVYASYLSGSGTTVLDFRYTIVSGNGDNNGVAVGTVFASNGGTIKDAAGNNATTTLNSIGNASGVLVDAISPIIESVGAPPNAIYSEGQNLDFTVNFSEAVIVVTTGGMPYIPVTLNTGGTVNASYQSGSGSTALIFRYTVVAGNEDNNGVAIGAAIMANGGILKDVVGNNAVLTLNNISSTAAVLVDAVIPTVSSVGVPSGATYAAGQNLDFTVNFSEPITIVTTGGIPYIPIMLNSGGTVNASYQSGTGTSTLVFRYTIISGNVDNDGVTVGLAITANGGTLKDAGGNSATLTLNNTGSTTNVLVDAIAPNITSVSSTTTNGTYKVADVIAVTVIFSKAVFVTGTPTLSLNSGGTASYSSGSSGTTLTFNYTVNSGNISADLDYSAINSLSLSGGTIKDAPGNNAAIILPAVGGASSLGGQKNIVVDGIVPIVLSVGVPANAIYIVGQNMDFTVTFSEVVDIVTTGGKPYIAVTLASGSVNATYQSGTGTSSLLFRYAVVKGDNDANGIVLGGSIALNGGTIKNSSLQDATLALNGVGITNGILVDAIAPTVVISSTANNPTNVSPIPVSINFSEPVTGFAIEDVVVTNGTVGHFTGSGSTYTVDITPVSQGIVKINIAGAAAQDAASNNNVAAAEFSTTYTVNAVPSVVVLSSPSTDATNQPIGVSLIWNTSAGASSYTVQVSTSSDFSSTLVNQSGIQNTSYNISGLSYDTKYYWRVKAVNINGASDWSTVWNFTTTNNVSVDEIISSSDYKLYPNPTKGMITIENAGEISSIMELYTMNGNIVMTKVLQSKKEKIDLSTISAGLYYIKLTNQWGSTIVKIIKL